MNEAQYEEMRSAITAALRSLSDYEMRELTLEPYRALSATS